MNDHYRAGYVAGAFKEAKDSNPHRYGTNEYLDWECGWFAGREEHNDEQEYEEQHLPVDVLIVAILIAFVVLSLLIWS